MFNSINPPIDMINTIRTYLALLTLTLVLTACGGGGSGSIYIEDRGGPEPTIALQVSSRTSPVRPGDTVNVTMSVSGFFSSIELYSIRPADGADELLGTFTRPPFAATVLVPPGRNSLDLFAILIDEDGFEIETPVTTVPIFR
jgi:hypothetical protein